MTIEQKLNDLGYNLPKPVAPLAAYVPVTRSGNLLFVSGQLSTGIDGLVKGHLGKDIDVEAGKKAA